MRIFSRILLASFVALLVTLLNVSNAQAADAPSTSTGSCTKSNPDISALQKLTKPVEKILDDKSMLRTFSDAGKGISGGIQGPAKALAGVLLSIVLAAGIANALASGKGVSGVVIDVILLGSIVAAVLAGYGSLVDVGVSLAESLNGAVGGTLFQALLDFLNTFVGIVAGVYNAMTTGFSCMEWGIGMIAKLIDLLFGLLILCAAMVLVVLAFAEILYVILLGPVLIGVAVATGPLFIATLASKATKSFFDKWLAFLASALLVQFVALLMLKLISVAMLAAAKSSGTDGSFVVQALGIALIAHMMSKLFQSVPGIASALTGGKLGMSSGGKASVPAAAAAVGGAVGYAAGIGVAAVDAAKGTTGSMGTKVGASLKAATSAAFASGARK
jgi:TrbL/VirB6 plasmid conjugal transfer protein